MNVLVVGGGAREHTLAWKLAQSSKVGQLYVAPGNAGTAAIAQNLDIPASDMDALAQAAKTHRIDLAVIGPEGPLASGIVDLFRKEGIPAFGPGKEAAAIEASKVFAKFLMHKYRIPCAADAVFADFKEAMDYVSKQRTPLVIKADGLAQGKGVIIARSTDEAIEALSDIMEKRVFGAAGERALVEECLAGREASLLAFTDGVTLSPLAPARDYKRVFDGDRGLNTGGMGAYSPPEYFDKTLSDRVIKAVHEPTLGGMAAEGKPYKGVLYAGLMLTNGGPKVLEYNARFGDPETQVQLPLLKTDLVDIMLAVINGTLHRVNIEWSTDACVGVVLASGGYPGSYRSGLPISGLDRIDPGVMVFHAGTKTQDGMIVTAGGRVLTVVATGKTIAEAREKVYANVPRIYFEGRHYRKDIAADNR